MPEEPAPRRRRRAVGPPGARAAEEPALDLRGDEPRPSPQDEERYRREQPPHHDRGV